MGAVAAAVLWRLTGSVSEPDRDRSSRGMADGRLLAAWTVLCASLLIPLAMLLLAFPDFYLG